MKNTRARRGRAVAGTLLLAASLVGCTESSESPQPSVTETPPSETEVAGILLTLPSLEGVETEIVLDEELLTTDGPVQPSESATPSESASGDETPSPGTTPSGSSSPSESSTPSENEVEAGTELEVTANGNSEVNGNVVVLPISAGELTIDTTRAQERDPEPPGRGRRPRPGGEEQFTGTVLHEGSGFELNDAGRVVRVVDVVVDPDEGVVRATSPEGQEVTLFDLASDEVTVEVDAENGVVTLTGFTLTLTREGAAAFGSTTRTAAGELNLTLALPEEAPAPAPSDAPSGAVTPSPGKAGAEVGAEVSS